MNDNQAPFVWESYGAEQARRMVEHIHRANLALWEGKLGVARDRFRKSALCARRAAAWFRAQPDPNTLQGRITLALAAQATADLERIIIHGDT